MLLPVLNPTACPASLMLEGDALRGVRQASQVDDAAVAPLGRVIEPAHIAVSDRLPGVVDAVGLAFVEPGRPPDVIALPWLHSVAQGLPAMLH